MPLNVGILGCGMITQVRHAPEYASDPRVKLTLVWDADPGRAQVLATQYGAQVATNPEALFAGGLDAVSVCTPNHLHGPMTLAALKKGLHVLCEKPMAASVDEARTMADAAREAGKVLMIGHNQRLFAAHQKARELLAAGAIGRLLSFRSHFRHGGPEKWGVNKTASTWFFDKARAQYGVMGDLGTHKIDLVRYLTGQDVEAVQGWVGTVDKKKPDGSLIDLEDEASVRLRLSSGAVGLVEVSWCHYGASDNDTWLFGDRGVLHVRPEHEAQVVVETHDGRTERYTFGGPWAPGTIDSGVPREFVSAILEKRAPVVSADDGVRAIQCLEATLASHHQGSWVEVPRG